MFVHFNGKVVNSDEIHTIVVENIVKDGTIDVYYHNDVRETITGPEAFNLVMELCPNALEGMNAKYARHAWAVHNLIGHPLMQVCAWLHLTSLGLKIHDMTVPNPKVE
jgi:hypothetical protein